MESDNVPILTPWRDKILFMWTTAMLFELRFCSHWIVDELKLWPGSILFVCSLFAIARLFFASGVNGITAAFGAMFIYSIGKTFFWPTMLAVVSDRFPRTGRVAISILGGNGIPSGGQLGGPGLGYAKDRCQALP